MQKHLEKMGEVTFEKIFNQKLGMPEYFFSALNVVDQRWTWVTFSSPNSRTNLPAHKPNPAHRIYRHVDPANPPTYSQANLVTVLWISCSWYKLHRPVVLISPSTLLRTGLYAAPGYCPVHAEISLLWPPYVIGQAIIFLPCNFFLSVFLLFPRLISAAAGWMSTILWHMLWP